VLEAEYLAGFRDARVIAPGESFEMAKLGAQYRAAARNSGVSTTEYDVGNVMRIMDELGDSLAGKGATQEQQQAARVDFLNNFLKTQQAFGSQITTETALAAYRNAKQSIYDWSPEFRNKYFPTLLQSAGEQGGTEMMTALNNYIGHHMQKTEIESLVKAGFVNPNDVVTDHGRTTFKDNAKLFEQDTFKSNIAQWAWDFHDAFMKRSGSTEDKFENLIDKMPRNMAGLIAFLNHNRARLQRDAATLDLPVGLAAATDASLGGNSPAALGALRDSILQFGAAVTAAPVAAAGPGLQALAHGIQTLSAVYGEWEAKHPTAAVATGAGAIAAGTATGGWLTWKLFTGLGRLFGFGSRVSPGEAAVATGVAGAEAAGSGISKIIGGVAGAASLPNLIDILTDDNRTPAAKANDAAILAKIKGWFSGLWGAPARTAPSTYGPQLPDRRADVYGPRLPNVQLQLPSAASGADARRLAAASSIVIPDLSEAERPSGGRNVHSPSTGPYAYYTPSAPASVNVSGAAQVDQTFHLDVSLNTDLLRAEISQVVNGLGLSVPLSAPTGTMDTDAAPRRGGGIGHM
jgi:hypothetical protein